MALWTPLWGCLNSPVLGVYYGCIGANILENPDFCGKKQTFSRPILVKKKSGSRPKSGNPDLVGDTELVLKITD